MRGENRGKGKYLRKWILIALPAVLLLAAAAVLIGNAVIKGQTAPWILTEEQAEEMQTDCILVLGAGVRDNGSPSHMLEDRLKKAIELYRAEISPKLLMSGDHGRVGYNEVGVMKRYAVREGVPESNVFMDHAGFSTYESLRRAKEVFGVQKVLIVTQGYHLYRALYIARQLGLEAYGVGADLRLYRGQAGREVREIAARIKDAVFCCFMPEPTYLGEAIPISGDGNLTNDKAYEELMEGELTIS